MFNIMKSDLYRILKGRLFVYSIAGLIIFGIFFALLDTNGNVSPQEIVQNGLSTASIFVSFFMIEIFVVVWGHEFNHRVVNNSLIFGVKRSSFFLSKVILTCIMVALFLSIYFTALSATVWVTSGGFPLLVALKTLGLQLPVYLAVSLMGVLLFNAIQSGYVAASVFIAIILVGEGLISSLIVTYLSKAEAILNTMLFENIRKLTNYTVISADLMLIILSSALVYGLLFYGFSYLLFKEREFK